MKKRIYFFPSLTNEICPRDSSTSFVHVTSFHSPSDFNRAAKNRNYGRRLPNILERPRPRGACLLLQANTHPPPSANPAAAPSSACPTARLHAPSTMLAAREACSRAETTSQLLAASSSTRVPPPPPAVFCSLISDLGGFMKCSGCLARKKVEPLRMRNLDLIFPHVHCI